MKNSGRFHTARKFLLCGIAAAAGILSTAPEASALSLTLTTEFSGGAQPAGTIKVDITPIDLDTVKLTVTSQLTADPDEFLTQLYLNLNPTIPFSELEFDNPAVVDGPFAIPAIGAAGNGNVAGSGKYDLLLAFAQGNAQQIDRFNLDDIFSVEISRAGGLVLTEADFNFISNSNNPNQVPFTAAAHVQGIGRNANDSGFIRPSTSVPDGGATVMLLGLSLAAAGLVRRYIVA